MRSKTLCYVLVGTLAASASALGHHGFSSIFDSKTILTLKGKVTMVDWRNPHVYVYLNETNSKGQLEGWSVEFQNPAKLIRVDVTKESITPGDEVTITAYPAWDKADLGYLDTDGTASTPYARTKHFARATEITLAKGKHVIVP